MWKVYKLVLPMDKTDMKIHPHIMTNNINSEGFIEMIKLVSWHDDFEMYNINNVQYLRHKFDCMKKTSNIKLPDIIYIEPNEYILNKKFWWKCKNNECNKCENGQMNIWNYKSLRKKIILLRNKIDTKIKRQKIFKLSDIKKYNK